MKILRQDTLIIRVPILKSIRNLVIKIVASRMQFQVVKAIISPQLEVAKGNDNGNRNSGGSVSTLPRCGKFVRLGHHTSECKTPAPKYFNCGEKGHISTYCQKLKKESSSSQRPQANGRVFDLNEVEALRSNNLIQGMRFISGVPLFVIIDTGVTH